MVINPKLAFVSLLTPLFFQWCIAQTEINPEKAAKLAEEANILANSGRYESAITRLEQSIKLDPENFRYPLDLAYIHYANNNYPEALSLGNKVLSMKNISDQCFQFVGNIHEKNGNPEKARKVYQQGMMQFPQSGLLHHELGHVMDQKFQDPGKAIELWENGIKLDPAYAQNYYRAAKYYARSPEKVWALIYGEAFMNLERKTPKTLETSKLVYNIMKEGVKLSPLGQDRFKLSPLAMLYNDSSEIDTPNLPFQSLFDLCMHEAVSQYMDKTKKPEIDLALIADVRLQFIRIWYESGFEKHYPNPLFQWEKSLENQEYLEPYVHWILVNGDPEAFGKWFKKNKNGYQDFLAWFKDNPMEIQAKNPLHREFFVKGKKPVIKMPEEEKPSRVPTRPSRYD